MHIQSGESTTLKRFTKLLVMTKRISTLPLVVPCKFPCHVEKAGEAVSDSKKPKSSGSDSTGQTPTTLAEVACSSRGQ